MGHPFPFQHWCLYRTSQPTIVCLFERPALEASHYAGVRIIVIWRCLEGLLRWLTLIQKHLIALMDSTFPSIIIPWNHGLDQSCRFLHPYRYKGVHERKWQMNAGCRYGLLHYGSSWYLQSDSRLRLVMVETLQLPFTHFTPSMIETLELLQKKLYWDCSRMGSQVSRRAHFDFPFPIQQLPKIVKLQFLHSETNVIRLERWYRWKGAKKTGFPFHQMVWKVTRQRVVDGVSSS